MYLQRFVTLAFLNQRLHREGSPPHPRLEQRGLNKKEIQLNLCYIFSILIFNELYLFA